MYDQHMAYEDSEEQPQSFERQLDIQVAKLLKDQVKASLGRVAVAGKNPAWRRVCVSLVQGHLSKQTSR